MPCMAWRDCAPMSRPKPLPRRCWPRTPPLRARESRLPDRHNNKSGSFTMRRLLLAATCVLLTAVPAVSQTLRIALRQDLDVLDPTLATTYVGRIVFAGLCDKLFDIDEKLNIVSQLATGYEWADDRTLVVHLRSGVKFHNGEVLDAAAVKYSLERHLTMQGSFRKSEISAIDHIEV